MRPPGARFCPGCAAPVDPDETTLIGGGAARPPASSDHRAATLPARTRIIAVTGGALLVALGTSAYLLFGRSAPQMTVPPGSEISDAPVVTTAPEADIASLADMTLEFDRLQLQADEANRRIGELLTIYRRRGGVLPPNFGADLTDDQRTLLAERLTQERSGLRNLLQEILDKDRELVGLRDRAANLRVRLPAYVDAREGDRHDRIVMDFLLQRGVAADQAYQLVSQINLQEVLLPGFRVWTHYQDGQFGTWVTRGAAAMTPQEYQRRLLNALESDRATATAAAEAARAAAAAANAETGAFIRIAETERARADAERARADAERALTSALEQDRSLVRYGIGTRRDLAAAGAITNNLRQVLSFEPAGVETLDPATRTDIRIDGSAYGLTQIRRITLLPRIFNSDVDVAMTIDGPFAVIRLLNPDKFRQNRFLVVLE